MESPYFTLVFLRGGYCFFQISLELDTECCFS
nr:MAG TPA: hypothetical protein [Caudoviricetes sp.]